MGLHTSVLIFYHLPPHKSAGISSATSDLPRKWNLAERVVVSLHLKGCLDSSGKKGEKMGR
jgi:hypothetical protein